ncbi:MAG: hypothetical protein BWZ03_00256 [bacterium ADurb.BinA186]|nr:MAG: hypothetical protein BWZ03_00256 [bacterium ADurb.BinA186]
MGNLSIRLLLIIGFSVEGWSGDFSTPAGNPPHVTSLEDAWYFQTMQGAFSSANKKEQDPQHVAELEKQEWLNAIKSSYPFVKALNSQGCFEFEAEELCGEICYFLDDNEFKYSFRPLGNRSENPASFSMVRANKELLGQFYDRVWDCDFKMSPFASPIDFPTIRKVDSALLYCNDVVFKPAPKRSSHVIQFVDERERE